jgi:hypothetical protein
MLSGVIDMRPQRATDQMTNIFYPSHDLYIEEQLVFQIPPTLERFLPVMNTHDAFYAVCSLLLKYKASVREEKTF